MQTRKPILGILSLTMAGFAFLALASRTIHHQSDLWATPTIIGMLCAVAAMRRNEQPKTLSMIGLFANLAIPTALLVLGVLGGLALGAWLHE